MRNVFFHRCFFSKKAGYEIYLFCPSRLKERIKKFTFDVKVSFHSFSKNVLIDFRIFFSIRKSLIRNGIDKVIINSANGIKVRNFLLLPFPSKIEFTGILHDAGKIFASGNQNLINRKIKKYFVLSDHVLEYVRSLKLKNMSFESFYPIFQPEYSLNDINKPDNEFWVCVPGRVEQKRRDYRGLLKNLSVTNLSNSVKIILLGKIDEKFKPELKDFLQKLNLNDSFILFDEFIPNEVFYSYLQLSNIVLPLIHPEDIWFEKYFRMQISGSYNMAFTYKIPMLIEKSFSSYEDFTDTSFFYETEKLINKINQLSADKDFFTSSKKKMYKLDKWDFDYQYKKYLEFIES